ncbi:MAG: 4Fe-4S binding protein [Acidobacteria bacterium]|nr:4Fe-4S binding protein [Acidobacteriota bacterium]
MDKALAESAPARGKPLGVSLLLASLMFLLSAFMFVGPRLSPDGRLNLRPNEAIAMGITLVTAAVLFFRMIRTGRTDRYRAIFFVAFAVLFVVEFTAQLVELRGTTELSRTEMMEGRTPFCHIVIPQTLIPAALTRTIIFPGSMLEGFAAVGSMLVLWIVVTLALGRGWCAWGCFYGGMDDGFSRLRKRPVIRKIDRRWRYLPFALLLVVALWAALSLSPVYCEWLCPFKAVTEHEAVTSTLLLVQTVVFVALFLGLVVILPWLSRKRVQCGLFCPFGAFQSAGNWVDPVNVRIDREKCVDCGRCARACPTFSLDTESISAGKARLTCVKCGKCMDECPRGAISYHVKGTPPGSRPFLARLLFVFPAFFFLVVIGGGSIMNGLSRILLFLQTGRMIH